MNTCLVIEDDFGFYLETESILIELGFARIDQATNIESIRRCLEVFTYDLIISDIMLADGEVSLDYFMKHPTQSPIIYMSVMHDEDLYERVQKDEAHIFLVKPINPLTLKSSIEYLKSMIELTDHKKAVDSGKKLRLKDGSKIVILELDEVKFIKSEGNYCVFHTTDRKITTRQRIAYFQDELQQFEFLRCHKSFIINPNFVQEVYFAKNLIQIDGDTIPIGRTYRDAIKSYYAQMN